MRVDYSDANYIIMKKSIWWSAHLFLFIPYMHNQPLPPSWITDGVNVQTQFWKGTTQGLFGAKLIPFHPVVLKKIFKDFSTNQKQWQPSWMKNTVTGHNFGRETSKEYHNQDCPGSYWEEDKNVKVDGRLTTKAHLNLWLWWAKRWY